MIKLKHLMIGVSLLLISSVSTAAIKTKELQSALQQRIDANPATAGVVVGIVDDKQLKLVNAGKANKKSNLKLNDNSLFEIGSISKTFTGILLADLFLKGEVSLDDPVVKYLPKGVTMPTRNGKAITLRHLATHTSGLPRLPTNFTPKDMSNPYVDFSVENLHQFISGYQLTRDIGATAEYSNLGMGLLGHVLALKTGNSYEQLVTERILKPLGMTDTSITLSTKQKKRMTTGHDSTGNVTPLWDIPTLAGAGALRSSGHDMMLYLQANMGLIKNPINKAIALSQKFQQPFGSDKMSVGLAWLTAKGPEGKVVWHNGGTGGFRSFIGFNKSTKQGVIVLANSNDNADAIGQAILKDRIETIIPQKESSVDFSEVEIEQLTGDYQLAPGFILTISTKDKKFFAQATGQQILPIFVKSKNEFFFKVVEASMTFNLNKKGIIDSLVLHQNGDHTAKKVQPE